MVREVVSLVKMKCQPGGKSLIPRKWMEVVKDRMSMPQSMPAGRSSRSIVAVGFGDVDAATVAMIDKFWKKGEQ